MSHLRRDGQTDALSRREGLAKVRNAVLAIRVRIQSPNFRISTEFYEKFGQGLGIQESRCLDVADPRALTPGPPGQYSLFNI